MGTYRSCPQCGNSKSMTPILRCKGCGHIGCSTVENGIFGQPSLGCISGSKNCPRCWSASSKSLSMYTLWEELGKIPNEEFSVAAKSESNRQSDSSQSGGSGVLIAIGLIAILLFAIVGTISASLPGFGTFICILLGYATFAVFCGGLFENYIMAVKIGAGVYTLGVIERFFYPYDFWSWAATLFGYGLVASIFVALVSAGIIKIFR